METLMLNADPQSIVLAAQIIRSGGLVAFPTETVYGLGADALNEDAVKSIFLAKGRPQDNPLIIHIANAKDVYKYCDGISEKSRKLAEKFWPGPLTMVFKAKDIIPKTVTCGLDTVAVRFPSHKVAQDLIKAAGVPIAAPSANISGRPSTTTAQHVLYDLSGKIPLILDDGACTIGVESTVISMTGVIPVLLRPGKISREEIEQIIGPISVSEAIFSQMPSSFKAQAPGMKYKHYSPKAEVTVIDGSDTNVLKYMKNAADKNTGILCFDGEEQYFDRGVILVAGEQNNAASLSRNLFSALRKFDDFGVCAILSRKFRNDGEFLGVYNRLMKAAAFKVKIV